MTQRPALFVSHGAPTFAIEPGLAGEQLADVGRSLDTPRAIVVVPPHWMTKNILVTASARPESIHDFGGFARELYAIQYPAPGAPEVAARAVRLLRDAGLSAQLDDDRGLDHGAWVPLLHMYPDANIPVVQVSLPVDADEHTALALGRALAPLADDGVLIIGSGSLTHNLYEFRSGDVKEAAYAREFSEWVREAVVQGDTERLLGTLRKAPHAARRHAHGRKDASRRTAIATGDS